MSLGSVLVRVSALTTNKKNKFLTLNRGTSYIRSFMALILLEASYKVVITNYMYNSSAEVINRIELICGKRPEFV